MTADQRLHDPGGLGAGNVGNRLSGAEGDVARRGEIAAAAARYLLRTGNGDLLPVLGLDAQQPKACKGCGELFVPRTVRQRYCRTSCSLAKAGAR